MRHLGSVTTRETFLFKPHALRNQPDVWLVIAEVKDSVTMLFLKLQQVLANLFNA